MSVLRKLFFWNYARNTWQWDILCVVILIFIFGAPKSWFENSERHRAFAHQNPTATTVLVSPELVEKAGDKGQLEQAVRTLTGRPEVQVLSVRKLIGTHGEIRAYEVDIR